MGPRQPLRRVSSTSTGSRRTPALRGRLLAPFLGDAYGEALADGDLRLHSTPRTGGSSSPPTASTGFRSHPRDYPPRAAGGGLGELAARLRDGRPAAASGCAAAPRPPARRCAACRSIARRDRGRARRRDPATPEGRERLHRLLERQNYRLAWWRAAADEINWRRFFDINGLAGVRVELPQVFDDTHATVLRLYAEGLIDGVRIDHVDGLADPRGYCRKLRRRLQTAAHVSRPTELRDEPAADLWVEKILAPHERLPTDWLTDGTTGYDFMNEVSAVLHDPAGEAPLTALWTTLTGRPRRSRTRREPARRQILRESPVRANCTPPPPRCTASPGATSPPATITLTAIRRALEELLVHFHVYRIYAGPAGISETDAAGAGLGDGGRAAQRAGRRPPRCSN